MWDLDSIRRANDSRAAYLAQVRAERERLKQLVADWRGQQKLETESLPAK